MNLLCNIDMLIHRFTKIILFAIILLQIALIPRPACAQYRGAGWMIPQYSSPGAGVTITTPNYPPDNYPYILSGNGYGNLGRSGNGTISCSGWIDVLFTWNRGSNSIPPPASVPILISSTANYMGYSNSCSCNDGMGDQEVH